jgi:hypothetical protein
VPQSGMTLERCGTHCQASELQTCRSSWHNHELQVLGPSSSVPPCFPRPPPQGPVHRISPSRHTHTDQPVLRSRLASGMSALAAVE